MEEPENQHLYARWLNNELTPAESERLEASGEAEILRQIVARMDGYRLPALDEQTYARIRERIGSRQPKVVPLYRRGPFLAIAASIALLVGLFWFYQTSGSVPVELAGMSGSVKSYTLSDQTDITLYGNSSITYDKTSFGTQRVLRLKGEAYFDVRKKGAFTVELPNGKIAVTGTRFNVLASDSLLSVRCYEGSVEVTANGVSTTLTEGKGMRIVHGAQPENYAFEPAEQAPGATSRNVVNVPLREVCASLSLQYGVTFVAGDAELDRSFTGTLELTDLETALTLVFEPMQISWRKEGKRIILRNR